MIEPEFNKGGIENYEPFDGYLAEQAAIFHQRALLVVIGFGNWGRSHWSGFDRAVASADILGTMSLNYHGIAERYWGLLHADGRAKSAFRWFRGN